MGKLKQGAFQGFIGKTGGLVGRRWKGAYIVSAYQPTVANPKSTKQLLSRAIFKEAVGLVKEALSGSVAGSLSTGWTGTTLYASNIGTTCKLLRAIYNANNVVDVSTLLSDIKQAQLSSGLTDFGNTIIDDFSIQQVGTTASFMCAPIDAEPGMKFFGSDIPLDNARMFCQTIMSGHVVFSDLSLSLTPQIVNQENAKAYGFFASADEVGNWNYVYRMSTSIGEPTGTVISTKYKGTSVEEAYCAIGWYVPNGVVFNSRVFYKQLTVTT